MDSESPPERASAPAGDDQVVRQRSAFVMEKTAALRQRTQTALRDIRLESQSWNESLQRSGLGMQDALLATAPVSPGMDKQPDLRTVLLDAAYQVK
jgi:hypothetical protein